MHCRTVYHSALNNFVSQCRALQCSSGPGGEALVHKSQTVRPRDEWPNTNCRICAHKYQMGTNPRWEAARNTNCRWKKSQLQMGEIRGGNAGNPAGASANANCARISSLHHRTFSIFLAVVDEDWRCSKPLIFESSHIKGTCWLFGILGFSLPLECNYSYLYSYRIPKLFELWFQCSNLHCCDVSNCTRIKAKHGQWRWKVWWHNLDKASLDSDYKYKYKYK